MRLLRRRPPLHKMAPLRGRAALICAPVALDIIGFMHVDTGRVRQWS